MTGGKNHASLLLEVQDRVSKIRAIERVITRTDFVEAFDNACAPCKGRVEDMIAKCDRDGVLHWIGEQLRREYGELPVRKLRLIAQRLRVPNYNNLPKDLLLSEIVTREQAKEGPDPGVEGQDHQAAQ
jgi:hypothetical protein